MPPIPSLSGKQVVRCFQKCGWEVVRQRGSHVILVKEGHRATLAVPMHQPVAKGTLRSLIRNSGMTTAAFLEKLKR